MHNETADSIFPFRWDISQRRHLGSLLSPNNADKLLIQLERQLDGLGRLRTTIPASFNLLNWLQSNLRRALARIIAFSSNADLVFVGRSPESLFDYASGLLADTTWAARLHLLHFSMSTADARHQVAQYPQRLQAFRAYLHSLHLSPQTLAARASPVAFIDIVASGRTFENLIRFIQIWAQELNIDWRAIQAKLGIIGLTEQTKTSPKTWRWQQHATWISLLPRQAIRNVSIPAVLFHYLGEAQPKTTSSYHPTRWGDASIVEPQYTEKRLQAIQLAVTLYDGGQEAEQRQLFRQQLQLLPAMQERWFRDLVLQLT